MVTDSLFMQAAQAIKQLAAKGEFRLAMLLSSDTQIPDMWNLVVSADWIDALGLRQAIGQISDALRGVLAKNNLRKIERISVLPVSDGLVKGILSGVAHLDTGVPFRLAQSHELSRLDITDAIVLAVGRKGPSGYHRKVSTVQNRA